MIEDRLMATRALPFIIACMTCVVSSVATAEAGGNPEIRSVAATPGQLRLEGTFVQYQPWMMTLDEPAWLRELDAFRRAEMRYVILQHMQGEQIRYIPDDIKALDPTEVILSYADTHHMQVFVGLITDRQWFRVRRWKEYLGPALSSNTTLADQIWKRYGTHRSFAGWYLPQEMWDGTFTAEQTNLAADFFRRLADHCHALSSPPRPVAISPLYKGVVSPKSVEDLYTQLLRNEGIDILMMQDGVGTKGWDDQVAGHVAPYYQAFQEACRNDKVEFWANIECFRTSGRVPAGSSLPVPADATRIRRQLDAAAPFVRHCVTFDAFHYMSPFRKDARAKQLYLDYLRLFVDRDSASSSRPTGSSNE